MKHEEFIDRISKNIQDPNEQQLLYKEFGISELTYKYALQSLPSHTKQDTSISIKAEPSCSTMQTQRNALVLMQYECEKCAYQYAKENQGKVALLQIIATECPSNPFMYAAATEKYDTRGLVKLRGDLVTNTVIPTLASDTSNSCALSLIFSQNSIRSPQMADRFQELKEMRNNCANDNFVLSRQPQDKWDQHAFSGSVLVLCDVVDALEDATQTTQSHYDNFCVMYLDATQTQNAALPYHSQMIAGNPVTNIELSELLQKFNSQNIEGYNQPFSPAGQKIWQSMMTSIAPVAEVSTENSMQMEECFANPIDIDANVIKI